MNLLKYAKHRISSEEDRNPGQLPGQDDDQYFIKSELGQKLLDKRALFLSKRAAASFGHFADAQQKRENAENLWRLPHEHD